MRLIIIVICAMGFSMNASESTIVRKAIYSPVEGTDVEYGQGAIERNELPHREVEPNVWLVRVPVPGLCAEWQRKLNEAVDPRHGSFEVGELSAEEQARVDRGEIEFQQ